MHEPLDAQALDRHAANEVRLDNLVDVLLIDKAVPNPLGIDHGDWTQVAAIQAAGLVDPYLPGAIQAAGFDGIFAVRTQRIRPAVLATGAAVGALIAAKEDVPLVETGVAGLFRIRHYWLPNS